MIHFLCFHDYTCRIGLKMKCSNPKYWLAIQSIGKKWWSIFLYSAKCKWYREYFRNNLTNFLRIVLKVLTKKSHVGNDLLSQEVALQVPSALTRLTSGFEMFPGIPTSLWSPTWLSISSFTESQYVVSFFFLQKTDLFLTSRLKPSIISTGLLNPSLNFHLQPI